MSKKRLIIKLGGSSTFYYYKDVFNDLPDNVLVNILSFMTTREAINTSILSSRWRNLWKSACNIKIEISHLVGGRGSSNGEYLSNLMTFFNKMKSSKIFKLYLNDIPDLPREIKIEMMDFIIRFCKARNVEDLVLNYGILHDYNSVFQGVYGIKSLIRLFVQSGSEKLGHRFETLPLLKTVVLTVMTVGGKRVEELISHCPLLESLVISISGHCTINHIKLQSLVIIDGDSVESSMWTFITPALTSHKFRGWNPNKFYLFENISSLTMCEFYNWYHNYSHCPKIIQLWHYLMNDLGFVKTISLNKNVIQDLIVSSPKELRLMNTSLVLNISLVCSMDVKGVAQVLSIFPGLEKLKIIIDKENILCGAFESEVLNALKETFSKMQEVKEVDIHGFINCSTSFMTSTRPSGTKTELIEVLLNELPAIEKLRIHGRREMKLLDENVQLYFLELFERFRFISEAKIEVH